jgi:putative ABC transport system permease protein
MFRRVLLASFARNPRRKALAAGALTLALAVSTAALGMALDVEDRLAREFRSLGANLLVTPAADTLPVTIGGVDVRPVSEGAYLKEADLGAIRMIFWRLNIVGFTPFLDVPVEARRVGGRLLASRTTLVGTWREHPVPSPDGTTFATGLALTHPWWRVEGRWFADGSSECVAGAALARRAGLRPGERITVSAGGRAADLLVTGLLTTGDAEDDAIVAPLATAQRLADRPGRLRRLLVSALTKPEDEFARRDRAAMSPEEYDRWYCTPYISSIAHQLQEALPGAEARAVRRVAEGEGRILGRVGRLLWAVTLAALAAAALAVGATAATTVLERREEVGLMKALGATDGLVGSLFLAEQLLIALVGGGAGYGLGTLLGRALGQSVFGTPPGAHLLLLPSVLVLAVLVTVIGNGLPLRRAVRFEPAPILRGE